MEERKYTPRQMRRDLLSDEEFPPRRVAFMLSDQAPYEHAAAAAQLMKSAQLIRERLSQPDPHDSEPMHASLAHAMKEAAEAAEEAFEVALKAAWQWYWLLEKCPCPSCRLRRQRDAAPLN